MVANTVTDYSSFSPTVLDDNNSSTAISLIDKED